MFAARLLVFVVASVSAFDVIAAPRPNIVVILADDMGFSDVGCYGGEIETPHLDRLAADGLRFTSFYNTGRCCPTRAALLTGVYQHQAGVGHMTGDRGVPSYQGHLNDRCVTIAEVLRGSGYRTMMCGKWHVGSARGRWPRDRGFDRFYGVPQGGGFYFRVRKGRSLVLDDEEIEPGPGWYTTDAFNDRAATFIGEAVAAKSPFFLYVAHIAPHWPLQARTRDIEKYRGKYRGGWDSVRAERHRRQLATGIVDRRWRLSPRDPQSVLWESAKKKDDLDLRMAVYAAQVDALDQGIGRLLASIDAAGVRENTLVLFLSDNGASAEGGLGGFSRGEKGAPIGTAASYASYGLGWANASNTPFRRYKSKVHEGGIATPLIVRWPAGIPRRGELETTVGHVMDILPTCVELAGATYPQERDGRRILPTEGRSLVPAFGGRPVERGALFWEHQGDRAVRRGRWKLVSSHKEEWELYDLEADRTELDDVAAKYPERVEAMAAEFGKWATRVGVRPWPLRK